MDPLARLITTIEELRGGCCDVGSTSCIVSEKEFDDAVQHRGQEKCRVAAAGPFADRVDDAVRFLVTERGLDRARVERVCNRAGNLLGRLFRWHPGDPQLVNGLAVDGLDTEADDVLRELRRLQALAGLPRTALAEEVASAGIPADPAAAPPAKPVPQQQKPPGDERDQPGPAAEQAEDQAELDDRQKMILETMSEHQIASERCRQTRKAIVRLINRTHKPQAYNHAFANLVKRRYLQAREGPGGGVWMTPAGKAEAARLRSPS
jgi:hypothetical protein